MADFLSMGGYGGYVWPAYILSLGLLSLAAWRVRRRLTQASGKLKALDHDAHGDTPDHQAGNQAGNRAGHPDKPPHGTASPS